VCKICSVRARVARAARRLCTPRPMELAHWQPRVYRTADDVPDEGFLAANEPENLH